MVARYLVAENPRAQLIEDYVYELAGSSLQSADQVQLTAGALGIEDAELRQQIGDLVALFTARNKVSHELVFNDQSGQVTELGAAARWHRPSGSATTASRSHSGS